MKSSKFLKNFSLGIIFMGSMPLYGGLSELRNLCIELHGSLKNYMKTAAQERVLLKRYLDDRSNENYQELFHMKEKLNKETTGLSLIPFIPWLAVSRFFNFSSIETDIRKRTRCN